MYLGRLVMSSPDWEPLDSDQLHTNRIVPIYPLTSGLSQRQIRKIIYQTLPFWSARVKEYLPEKVFADQGYPLISDAIRHIHFPEDSEQLDQARARFAFEEIFFLQLGVLAQKTEWSSQTARRYPLSADRISLSESRLPFQTDR